MEHAFHLEMHRTDPGAGCSHVRACFARRHLLATADPHC
ncbi:MAG: hypothetical protein QOE70_1360 [Chthoniobacter sp.]|jgi:hypothetical protein|nr:hypothetical protein [Chthoniobacter sp.]